MCFTERFPLKDSSTLLYKFFGRLYQPVNSLMYSSEGDLYRRPRCQFRALNGLTDGMGPRNTAGEEKLHFSVPFLTMNRCVEKSELCISREDAPTPWVFSKSRKLHPRFPRPHPSEGDEYSVNEEALEAHEGEILSRWAENQHDLLFREDNEANDIGAPWPNTIVVHLRGWLQH